MHLQEDQVEVMHGKVVLYQETNLWETQQDGGQEAFTVHCAPYPLDRQQEIDHDEEDDVKNDNDAKESKTFRFEPRYPS